MFIAPSTVFQCWAGYVGTDYYIIMTMYHTHAIPWGDVRVDAATGYTYSWTIEDILTQLLLIE